MRVTTADNQINAESPGVLAGPCCASVSGVNVNAGVCVPARDRVRLERLSRYTARPPLALERLSLLPDGRLLYRLKRRWRNGTTHVIFEPLELVEKLAALVPPPRFNLVRYHGVLAPVARWRRQVVPSYPLAGTGDRHPHLGCKAESSGGINLRGKGGGTKEQPGGPRPRNYCWAELMRRVFAVDLFECPRCSGPMRILAEIPKPNW